LHDAADTAAVFGWGVGVEGVGVGCVTDEFGEDVGATVEGVGTLFEDEDAGTLSYDEAVAIHVPGAGGGGRVVIAGGEGAHGGEARDGEWSYSGFAAAADYDVGVVALEDAEGFADGVGSGGAGGGGREVGTVGAVADGDLSGGEIGDGGIDEERRDATGAGGEELCVLALNDFECSDAAADVDTYAFGDLGGDFEGGLFDGEVGGGEGELDEAAHLLEVFAVDEVFRDEVFDFAGDAGGVGGSIEEGDGADAGMALLEGLPGLFCSYAHGANKSYSGYDDATLCAHVGGVSSAFHR
jgi:hypothetical protein